jgi:hypothetical protein
MSLPRSSAALAAVLLGLTLGALPAHAATRDCDVQKDSGKYGPSYVTSLKVTNASCPSGKKVVRAFHSCRKAHGGIKGRCPKRTSVLGYRCRETRQAIGTQFTGKVTCTSGSRRVVHTYTQFT